MVCNLAVLVTWFMRAIGRSDDSEVQPSERTPNSGADGRPPKDLTTLRFHHTGPIVLQSLDKAPVDTHSVASNDSLQTGTKFGAGTSKQPKADR